MGKVRTTARTTPAARPGLTPATRSVRTSASESTVTGRAKQEPAKAGSAKAASAKAASAKAGSAKAAPSKVGSAKAAPAKAGSAKAAPAKAGSAKAGSAKAGSAKTSAAQATAPAPAKAAPAKATPAKAAPSKATPAKAAPSKATQAKAAPSKATSSEATPAKAPPSKAAKAGPAAAGSGPPVPKDSDWTAAALAEIRTELVTSVDRMRSEYEHSLHELDELQQAGTDGAGDDQADAGSKTFDREQELSIAANRFDLLSQMIRAVERLDQGTYGFCENCGKPIPRARLQAFPMATLDVVCKQREERR